MVSSHRVLLVRPWTDHRGGGGCCSGGTGNAVGPDSADAADEHPHSTRVVARAYQRLREELPGVDVQIVSASNTVYLLPTVIRTRRHGRGRPVPLLECLRSAHRATSPGAVLVDGTYAGDVVDLGPEGVLSAVRDRLPSGA